MSSVIICPEGGAGGETPPSLSPPPYTVHQMIREYF
jgi:hypothetical protein